MELTFEYSGKVGSGKYPDFIQFYNTEGQLFFTDTGLIHGTDSARFDGDFTSPQWNDIDQFIEDYKNKVAEIEKVATVESFWRNNEISRY